MTLSATAPAKVNLALHVTGERDDGYHDLDTIAVFTGFGDQVSVTAGDRHAGLVAVETGGPFAGDLGSIEDNLVSVAARMLAKARGGELPPVRIVLDKRLPVASGLGGGSADAAAVLKLLARFWRLGERVDLASIAGRLGADVPMCLRGVPLRARGRGDEIAPLDGVPALWLVLASPLVGVDTGEIFTRLENKANAPIGPVGAANFVEALAHARNDLQAVTAHLVPQIEAVVAALAGQPGCELARMSGSGAACFGLFSSERAAQAAAARIEVDHAHWWCVATSTIASPALAGAA